MDKEFKGALESTFNTESGKRALAYLKEQYVEISAIDSTPEMTYYNLGKKELVQGLIQLLTDPDELNDIVVYNNQEV